MYKNLSFFLLFFLHISSVHPMESDTESTSSQDSTETVLPIRDVFFGKTIKRNLLERLKAEKKGIWLALYDLNDPDIIDQLAKKKCPIHLFMDEQSYHKPMTFNALHSLKKKKNIHISTIGKRYKDSDVLYESMHEKMMYLEGEECAWLASYNPTVAGPSQWNTAYISDENTFLYSVINEFRRLITFKKKIKEEKKDVSEKKVFYPREIGTVKAPYEPAYFSPSSIPALLSNMIGHEKKGVKAALFRFTYCPLARALTERKEILHKEDKKFKVSIEVDKDFQSDHPEAIRHIIENGGHVFCNTDGKLMHHKLWLFLKNRKGKPVIAMGSYNPTGQADRNWENICIIDDPDAIKKCEKEFSRLAQHRAKINPKEAIYLGSKPKSAYTKRMNGIPGY